MTPKHIGDAPSDTLFRPQAQQCCEMLKIGIEEMAGAEALPILIESVQQCCPGLGFTLHQRSSDALVKAVRNGSVDIGVRLFYNESIANSLCLVPLCRDELVLLYCAKTLGRIQDEASLIEFCRSHPLFLPEDDSVGVNMLIKVCMDMHITPSFKYCLTLSEIITRCEAGEGYALLPRQLAARQLDGALEMHSLASPYTRICYVAIWNNSLPKPLASRLPEIFPIDELCGSCEHPCCTHRKRA